MYFDGEFEQYYSFLVTSTSWQMSFECEFLKLEPKEKRFIKIVIDQYYSFIVTSQIKWIASLANVF